MDKKPGWYEVTEPPTSAEVEEHLYSALVRRALLNIRVLPRPDLTDNELNLQVNSIEKVPDGGLSVRGILTGRRQFHMLTSPQPEQPASVKISKT